MPSLRIFEQFLLKLSTAPCHWGRYGGPNFFSMFCSIKKFLNSRLVNSGPLSLCIIWGLWWVAKQLFNAFITVWDVLSLMHLTHPNFEKWSTIVKRYLCFLDAIIETRVTKSIWNLSNGFELLIWWTIVPFLSLPVHIWQIWHL